MTEIQRKLQDHPFTHDLPAEQVSVLVDCARLVEWAPDEVLFRTGRASRSVLLLVEGRVAIEIVAPGTRRFLVETVGPGGTVGWSWLVPPHLWLFDGRATVPTNGIVLDAARLRAACDADPSLGYALSRRAVGVVGARLAGVRLQLLDLYGRPSGEP